MAGSPKAAFFRKIREARIGLVLLTCSVVVVAVSLWALYRDRHLIQDFTQRRVRHHLQRDLGLEYDLDGSRFRLFPLRVDLEGVTVYRRGDPWTLTVERAEVSVTLYSLFFQREGMARVKLIRPNFLQRSWPGRGEPVEGGGGRPAMAGLDLAALLTSDVPLRELEIVDGRLQVTGGEKEGLTLQGVTLSALLSGGRMMSRFGFEGGALLLRGEAWELGTADSDVILDGMGLTLRKLEFHTPFVRGDLEGQVKLSGRLELQGSLDSRVGEVTERLGHGRPLEAGVSFRGKVKGSLFDPFLTGRVALTEPVTSEGRWPGLKGTVTYKSSRLAWKNLNAALGSGKIRSEGEIDFSARRPRYTLSLEAAGIEPEILPVLRGKVFEEIRGLKGRLEWKGEGLAAGKMAGAGSADISFFAEGWKPGRIRLEGEAALDGNYLEISRFAAESAGLSLGGLGVYRLGGRYRAWVRGGTEDVSALTRFWGSDDYGGRLFLEGEVSPSPGGIHFEGPLRWDDGRVFALDGVNFTALAIADGRVVSLSDGLLRWRGGSVKTRGAVFPATGRIDLDVAWRDLPISHLARLFKVDEDVEGIMHGDGRIEGEVRAPQILGRFRTGALRFRDVSVDSAEGAVSWIGRELKFSEVALLSGESRLAFTGEIHEDRTLDGTFEGEAFDLKDFMPTALPDVSGLIIGHLGGTFDDPVLLGQYRADRLSIESWSFQGSEGVFEYVDHVFTLEGHLAEDVNRLRIKVEPRGDWPFEASLELERFSPELAKEAYQGLPEEVRNSLEGLSFLAVGSARVGGSLGDPRSIGAELEIEKIWVYTTSQTLQNIDPVRLAWGEGRLTVDKLSLRGEDYYASVSGYGDLESGWDLHLDGLVDLAFLQVYWKELERINALGDVRLNLSGPWDDPGIGGTIQFRGGSVKARSLTSPILDLRGEGIFDGQTFTLKDFSGRMEENAFSAAGTYELESGLIDASVEGRLDLAVFKTKIPGARELKGTVEAKLALKGEAASPEILGEARLMGGEIFLASMPERITELAGVVRVEEDGVELREVTGLMGNGEVKLDGSVNWAGEEPQANLYFRGRKVLLLIEGTAKALLDADLTLTGALRALELSGGVKLLKARYFREFDEDLPTERLKGLTLPDGRAKEGEGVPVPNLENMALDVRIIAPDRLWLSNSMVELENSLSIRFGGTLGTPQLEGEMNLLRGEVVYFSRRFTLYSGRIYNSPPGIHLRVEAQAEVVVGDTRINLLFEGPLDKPKLLMTSSPPLSQEDLIALLTVGQTRSSLEEQESEALAIGAALVLTGPLIEQVGESAREVTGIEIFQVEPYFSEDISSAKVTVGTQLSDRLFLSASQNIGVTEDQQVRLEYQILDFLSILGQQLKQGIYSLDMVYHLKFE